MGSLFSKEDRRKIDRLLELKTRPVTYEEKQEGQAIERYFREKDMSVLKYEGVKSAELRAALEDEEKHRSDSSIDYEPIFPRLESSPSSFDGDSQAYVTHDFHFDKDRNMFERHWWLMTRMVEELAWSLNLRRNFIIFTKKMEEKLLAAPEPLASIYRNKFDEDFNLKPDIEDSIIGDFYRQLKDDAQNMKCIKAGIRPVPDMYIRKAAVLMYMIREFAYIYRVGHRDYLGGKHENRQLFKSDDELFPRWAMEQNSALRPVESDYYEEREARERALSRAEARLWHHMVYVMDACLEEVLNEMGPQRVNHGKDERKPIRKLSLQDEPGKFEGAPPLSPAMNLVSRSASRFYGLPEDAIRDINRMLDLMICHHIPYVAYPDRVHYGYWPHYKNSAGRHVLIERPGPCSSKTFDEREFHENSFEKTVERVVDDKEVRFGRVLDKDGNFLGWEKTDWKAHVLGMPKLGYQLDRHPAYDGKPTIWDPAYSEHYLRTLSPRPRKICGLYSRKGNIPWSLRPLMTDLPADKRDEGYEFDLFYGPKPNAHVRAYALLKGLITAGYVDKDNLSFSDIALATRWAFYTALPASLVITLDMMGEKPNWWTPQTDARKYNAPYQTMLQGQIRHMEEVLSGPWKNMLKPKDPLLPGNEPEPKDEMTYIRRVPEAGRNLMEAVSELNSRLEIRYQADRPDGDEIISRAIAYEFGLLDKDRERKEELRRKYPKGKPPLTLKELRELGRLKHMRPEKRKEELRKIELGVVFEARCHQWDEVADAIRNRLDRYSPLSLDCLFMRSFSNSCRSYTVWSLPEAEREKVLEKAKETYGIDFLKAREEIDQVFDSTRPDGGRSIIIKDPRRPDIETLHLYPDYVYGNLFKVEKVEKDQYGLERIHIDPSSIHKNLNERNFTKEEILQALQNHEKFRNLRLKDGEDPFRDGAGPIFDDGR